jgi:hypothetical protein
MTEYYDIVLGLVPLALIGVTGSLSVAGWSLTSAVTLAGVMAVLVVGHAMFVNGPVDEHPVGVTDRAGNPPAFDAAD